MKSILLATTFLAAFATSAMAAKATTNLPASPAYNWTGAYVGGQLGYSWGDSRFNDGASSNTFDIDGFLGGVTLGYNYQFNPHWVAGVETDFSFADIDGSFGPGNLGQPGGALWGCFPGSCVTEVKWFATARARLGYAFGNVLLYGTGGLAVGRVESQIENEPTYVVKDTNVGWAAGGGVEYAFNANWTAKLEYMHVDLGWTSRNEAEDFKSNARFDAVRVGLNYKF
jgi:outer membrane immunogenic protein